MKKIKKILLPLLVVAFCIANTHYTHAEGADILKSISLLSQGEYRVGDEMTFDVEATKEIRSMNVSFYNPVSKDGHYNGRFTIYLNGNCSVGDQASCTFSGHIPEKIDGYYGTEENDHIEMTIYPGTYEVESIFVYDNNSTLTRYTTNKEYADRSDSLYYPSKIGVYIKGETQKDGPDILKSISLYTQTSNYYIGDKMLFDIDTTEGISSANITFYNSDYGMFTVYLTQDSSNNESTHFYSGYIPKTIAGYYAKAETGRSEFVMHPGTYEINSIFLYDKNGKYIRYTTNKEYADTSEFLYYQQKIAINLKEPTADELNDVNFVLDKLNIKKQTAAIGGQVPLEVKYSYNDTNKKIKSIYLIFRDPSKKKTFTTYVKSLFSNPYFIVASSADMATYNLDSVGITFETTDGTNNTIIINSDSNSGRYSEIFKQTIAITDEGDSADETPYFSADELNDEVYKRIQNNKEDYITIDADNYTIIPLQLFDVIKNSNKSLIIKHNNIEWVFDNANIKTPKDIDVLVKFYEMNNSNLSDNLKKALSGKAVVLEFSNNGELPGVTLIRIKDTEIINKLAGEKYYIYYADTENDKLDKVALEVQKTPEGYIEFYINHNSKYILSSTEITDQTVLGKDDSLLEKNIALAETSPKKSPDFVLICSLIIVACILVAIIATIIKKTKKPSKPAKSENISPEQQL